MPNHLFWSSSSMYERHMIRPFHRTHHRLSDASTPDLRCQMIAEPRVLPLSSTLASLDVTPTHSTIRNLNLDPVQRRRRSGGGGGEAEIDVTSINNNPQILIKYRTKIWGWCSIPDHVALQKLIFSLFPPSLSLLRLPVIKKIIRQSGTE